MRHLTSLFAILLSLSACSEDPPGVSTGGGNIGGDGDGDGDGSGYPGSGDGDGDGDGNGSGGPPPLTGFNCDGTRTFARPLAPDVLIVQDRSSSMLANFTLIDRWAPSVQAVNGAVEALQDRMRFGLMTFPSATDFTGCGVDEPHVGFMFKAANDIAAALASNSPTIPVLNPQGQNVIGHTPTGPALREAHAFINTRFSDGAPLGAAYVVLVTDGAPTCGDDIFSTTAATVAAATSAVDDMRAEDIKTFVIGYSVSEAQNRAIMQDLAQRGGTGDFISVEDGAALRRELDAISKRLTPCKYHTGKEAAATEIEVTIDGKTVPQSETNGWSVEGTVVHLNGPACDQIQDGKVHDVEVIVPCPILI